MLDLDLTPVWKALNEEHVLLLVDTHFVPDPLKHTDGGYDLELFEERLDAIHSWFKDVVSEQLSTMDFKLKNNAILSVRPLLSVPFSPKASVGVKVMVLR